MAPKRTKVQYIKNDSARLASLRTRKKSIMKRAYQLGVVCGVEVIVLISTPTNKLYEFSNCDIGRFLQQYSARDKPPDQRCGPGDFDPNHASDDQTDGHEGAALADQSTSVKVEAENGGYGVSNDESETGRGGHGSLAQSTSGVSHVLPPPFSVSPTAAINAVNLLHLPYGPPAHSGQHQVAHNIPGVRAHYQLGYGSHPISYSYVTPSVGNPASAGHPGHPYGMPVDQNLDLPIDAYHEAQLAAAKAFYEAQLAGTNAALERSSTTAAGGVTSYRMSVQSGRNDTVIIKSRSSTPEPADPIAPKPSRGRSDDSHGEGDDRGRPRARLESGEGEAGEGAV